MREWPWRPLKVIEIAAIRQATYHFVLVACSNNDPHLVPFPIYYHIYSARDCLWPWEVLQFR